MTTMPKQSTSSRFIRASELARWAYCRRAWWLQYIRGYAPANRTALRAGRLFHQKHGRSVERSRFYRRLAQTLFTVAVLIALLALVLWMWAR